ncbi:hypothetical protein [Catenuloplanes japonicus]|uniref:hypothetical protein n=1 Tax=Catenuloplanes japonicus TaxID=33876 RepID=UPI0006908DB0|nr:hypothetical protein [Catenuloplanes japonicus]
MTDTDDVIEAMERAMDAADPEWVAAVRAEVNAGLPWWHRYNEDAVADMLGALQIVVAMGEPYDADSPWLLAALVRLSGRRPTARTVRLAHRTVRAVAAIQDWGSRPR